MTNNFSKRHPLLPSALIICTLWLAGCSIVILTYGRLEELRRERTHLTGQARKLQEAILEMRANLALLMQARSQHDAIARRSGTNREADWKNRAGEIAAKLNLPATNIRLAPESQREGAPSLRFYRMRMDLLLVHELDLFTMLDFLAQEGPGRLEEHACQIERNNFASSATDRLSARCDLAAIMLPVRKNDAPMP